VTNRNHFRVLISGRPASLFVILALFVLVSLAAGGCGFVPSSKADALERRVSELEKQVAELAAKNEALEQTIDRFTQTVTLYFIKNTPTEMYLSPVKRRVARTGDLFKETMEELVKGPDPASGLGPVLPADTRVLGVTVKDGTAYVDFSPEVRRLNVGSRGEALVLAAIADTLTEFPGVRQVQILVAGKVIESLGGHFAADRPLTRNETVIK